jgi:hypothetical protein
MVLILVSVLAWLPALLGLGAVLPYQGDPALRRAVSGLLGLVVTATVATIAHFLVPVGPVVTLSIWTVGVTAFAARREWLAEGLTTLELVGTGLALAWLLFWMQAPGAHYDSGLYYLQTVRWATEQPLRPGLANLHGRLGFNSAWHMAAAGLELPGLAGRSAAFANVLPMVFTASAAMVGLGKVVSSRVPGFPDLALALLLPVTGQAVGGLGAAAPDQVASLFLAASVVLWIIALEREREGFPAEARSALVLTVFACAIKPSAAPILLLPAIALVARRRNLSLRWLAGLALLCGCVMVPWLARSFLLSGCLVYPAPATCAPGLPWSVPAGAVRSELDWIRSWARTPAGQPSVVLADWGWLHEWALRVGRRSDVALFGATAAVGLALAAAAGPPPASLVLPVASALLGIAFVFLSAPDPRFAFGFLHALGLVPLAFGVARLGALRRSTVRWGVVLLVVLLAARWARVGSTARRAADWLDFPEPPVARTAVHRTTSGLAVEVPVVGDQCWGAPLPCTPGFDAGLHLDGRMFRPGP